MTPIFLTTRALAARWLKSQRTLERWRRRGTGPAWIRIGNRILHDLADIEAFEAAQRRNPGDAE